MLRVQILCEHFKTAQGALMVPGAVFGEPLVNQQPDQRKKLKKT